MCLSSRVSNLPESDYFEGDSGDDNYEAWGLRSQETTTGKFFFPTGDLPKDYYYLALAFYVSADVEADTADRIKFEVEVGPHLISVEKIKTEDNVCDVSIVDDDESADIAFDNIWNFPDDDWLNDDR